MKKTRKSKHADVTAAMLVAAAMTYAESVEALHAAIEAHSKNSNLDEFDDKRCKTETAEFFAERIKDRRKDDLCACALLLAGGKAAEIGRDHARSNKVMNAHDEEMMRAYGNRNKQKTRP